MIRFERILTFGLLCCMPVWATVRNVQTCGATGNGTTDDTAAINTCIGQLVAGDTLLFPAGTYLVTSLNAINVSNVVIDGSSNTATVISKTTQQGPIFIVGTTGFNIGALTCSGRPGIAAGSALSATANETSTSFSTSSSLSGVGVGSYVLLLQGGEDSSSGSGNTGCDISGCRSEFAKIKNASGSTYTVDTMLHDTYSPSVNGAIACPVNGVISNVTLQNITLDGGTTTAQTSGNKWVAEFNTCANCTISGVTFRNALGAALLHTMDYNLTLSNVTVTGAGSEGCQAALEGFGNSNVTMTGVSLSSLNPGTGTGACLGDGAFGVEESALDNGVVTNLTVNSAGAGGRPMKLTAARWNTWNSLTVENGNNAAGFNGLSYEYYSSHNLVNGGSILNNAGSSGSGSAGINTFGNFNQYNTFYNLTVTGNGNVQVYNSGFDDLDLAEDWYDSYLGNTIGGSSTYGLLYYGSHGCGAGNTFNSGLSAGISVSSPSTGTVGSGNTLNGNSSNLTSGSCSTTGANGSGPLASLSAPDINFGSQAVNTTSGTQTVTLTNGIGSFSGTNGLSFAVTPSLQSGAQFAINANTCSGTVPAGGTCTVTLTFAPTSTGTQSDTLTFLDNGGGAYQAVALSGAGVAPATSYYVSSSSGNDANNGTSAATPWATLGAHVNGGTFAAGDVIYLKRGDTWNEQLIPPSPGAPGNPISFDAYGTGAAPVLTPVINLAGASWTHNTGNIYTTTLSTAIGSPQINNLHLGNVWGRKRSPNPGCTSAGVILGYGDFCVVYPTLYVYSPNGTLPSAYYSSIVPVVGQPSGLAMVSIAGKAWITVQHLKIQMFDYMGISVTGASDNLVFANMEVDGMVPYGATPLGFYVNGTNPTNIQFINDDAHLNYDGFRFDGTATAITVTNCRGYANRDTGLKDNPL